MFHYKYCQIMMITTSQYRAGIQCSLPLHPTDKHSTARVTYRLLVSVFIIVEHSKIETCLSIQFDFLRNHTKVAGDDLTPTLTLCLMSSFPLRPHTFVVCVYCYGFICFFLFCVTLQHTTWTRTVSSSSWRWWSRRLFYLLLP